MGLTVEQIPQNGDFDINIEIESVKQDIVDGDIIIALYDNSGKLISLQTVEITEEILSNGLCPIHIDQTETNISLAKIFIWESLTDMTPVAFPYEL